MVKIGICFPQNDYENMEFAEFKKYLLMFKEEGIYSFDFYTNMFLNNDENLKRLLIFLNEHDIKITFHYYSVDKNNFMQYQQDLIRIRNVLDIYNINYPITIVFHAQPYESNFNKYEHLENIAKEFEKLSEFARNLNFVILVETLSYNHPKGNNISDDIDELIFLTTNVKSNNFGFCWDVGHTRLNHIENKIPLYLPKILLDKVKFTHIHNVIVEKDKTIDHVPLTNLELQKEEIKYLIKNNYDGIFSLEFATKNLRENIYIYIDSIKKLRQLIEEITD